MESQHESRSNSQIDNNSQQAIRKDSTDENMIHFRDLLMRENLDIVAKLKKYKRTDFRRKIVLDQLKELKKLSELSKMWVSVPYIKQKFDYPVITVDSSKAGSNIDALRLAINDLGWKEYPNGSNNKPCHVVWNSCSFNDNRNNNGSFVNKHPGITQCLHKVAFSRILETMRTLFPDHFSFYPLTWYLPHQMLDFSVYCKNRESTNKSDKYYIVKPDAGTQGEGIYLIQKPQDYKISSRTYVVQEYLANPLLLDGFKFDLRIYAILMSLDPLKIYLCDEGLARFCTKRYVPPSTENLNINYMHLTNYTLNKKSNEFVHTQNLDSGSKRTVTSVFAHLEAEGYNVSNIWKRLEELVYKTILAIVPQLKVHYINEIIVKSDYIPANDHYDNDKDRPTCFQILGFDILIMDDLEPVLLEVNSNPSMRLDCEMEIASGICEYYVSKVDVKIKKPLVRDTLRLLQQDICDKFNLDLSDLQESKDWINRSKDKMPNEDNNMISREGSSSSEKENVSEICRKWSAESEFGPHFMEIAKQNNILPKNFEINRPNSVVDLSNGSQTVQVDSELEIQVTISGTSPHIRRKQQQKRYDQLAREKSWLNIAKPESDKISEGESIDENENCQPERKESFEKAPVRNSCLTLISTESYKYLFDDLRILEETTIIFYNAMGHRYSENMGATAFRTFGRQCRLNILGFNHAMIDLIYIEVQRRWSFINNFDNKQGLCYQAFLEAFFRIAFAKFSDLSKCIAVQNLIDHCKRSIGSTNFNWTKTLYPTNENQSLSKEDYKKYLHSKSTKRYKSLSSQNNNNVINQKFDTKSSSSDSSFDDSIENTVVKSEMNQKFSKQISRQSKYELMKVIHEIYRKKIHKSNIQKPDSANDSDSIKSLPLNKSSEKIKNKKTNLPFITRTQTVSSDHYKTESKTGQKTILRTYTYDKPESSIRTHNNGSDRKSSNYIQREYKTIIQRSPSPHNKSDLNSGSKLFNIEKSYSTKLSTDFIRLKPTPSRMNKNQQLSPINNERMRKLISVYGADSQDFLKRSLDKINKRHHVLKPI